MLRILDPVGVPAFLYIGVFFGCVLWSTLGRADYTPAPLPGAEQPELLEYPELPDPLSDIENQVLRQNPEVSERALSPAFEYLEQHLATVSNTRYLTVIDFDRPSTAQRMYVIDLHTALLTSYLVAHGKNSGLDYATHFSNTPGSDMSSLGIYLTGPTYQGEHGLSLILKGQEPSNSNAEMRRIVLHGASYATENFVHLHGRLGRSDGCAAVDPRFSAMLSTELSSGSVFMPIILSSRTE